MTEAVTETILIVDDEEPVRIPLKRKFDQERLRLP
jgi:hypothetical protein